MLDSCVNTQGLNQQVTTTKNVTYDGVALCTGISSGDLNAILLNLANAICAIQQSLAILTVKSDDVEISAGIVPGCTGIVATDSLTSSLNELISLLCGLQTDLATLCLEDIETCNLTVPNCFGLTNGMTLDDALDSLISQLCAIISSAVATDDHYHHPKGEVANPLIEHSGGAVVHSDISTSGFPIIKINGATYYVDDHNVTKTDESIILTNNSDNYLFLDNTHSFAWTVSAVAIGAPAPITTGAQVFLVNTGAGVIVSVIHLLAVYAIDNTLLADDCVNARTLADDIVSATGAILIAAGKLSASVDNIGIEIATNKLALKNGGVSRLKLNADVVGDGITLNGSNQIQTENDRSITKIAGKNTLVGDIDNPGVDMEYSTNSGGAKSWYKKGLLFAELTIDHANILTGYSVPILAVPNPGVGIAAKLMGVAVETKNWTTQYTLSALPSGFVLITDTATLEQYKDTTSLGATVSRIDDSKEPITAASATSTRIIANKGIYFKILTADPFAGSGLVGQQLKIYMAYCLVTV